MENKKAAAITAAIQYMILEHKNQDIKIQKENAYKKYLKESPSPWRIISMADSIIEKK